MISVLHKDEVGNGLAVEESKLVVKAGRNVTVDDNGVHVDLPVPAVEIHLAGLTFESGKLKATLNDNSTVETEFSAEIVVAAIEAASDEQKARIVEALKTSLLDAIKGEELQNFAGTTRGYLLAK